MEAKTVNQSILTSGVCVNRIPRTIAEMSAITPLLLYHTTVVLPSTPVLQYVHVYMVQVRSLNK